MSPVDVQRLGLSVLASGEKGGAKPIANIVFVHGLRGHPKHTWEQHLSPKPTEKDGTKRNSSRFFHWRSRKKSESPVDADRDVDRIDASTVYWPQDLLPHKIPNARIITYGYNADVIGGLFEGASKNSITQHAQDMMLQLEREVQGEPIIFVAHSLGGIIVKDGLHWSKSNPIPRYRELHRCTKSIVFLGVPHRGSPTASVGKMMTRVANAALLDTNKHLLSSLAVDGEILDRIHSEFKKMLYAEDFSVHSFQEGRGVSAVKGFSAKVVDDFSSKLDSPLEVVETIDANHMQMARFTGVEDPGYRKVSSVIATFVVHLQRDREAETSTATVSHENLSAEPTPPVELLHDSQAQKRYFRVPYISNHHFIGRVKELEWLRTNLEDLAVEGEQQRLVVWGPGGAGKTQLISTYAFRNRSKYSAIFWVNASSNVTVRKNYADIGKHLGLATEPSGDQRAIIDSVKDWFTDHKRGDWLLVIDNADRILVIDNADRTDEVDIESLIPSASKGSIIITSRDRKAAGFGPSIELGEMDPEDASSLLLRRAAIQCPSPADEKTAAEIVKSLGYLALAIEHAGSYVQSVSGSLQDYQLQFQRNRKATLAKRGGVSMHRESVSETFNFSFDTIKVRKISAAKLLCFLVFLDAEFVLENLILCAQKTITVFWARVVKDEQEYHDAIQELLSFALIRIRREGDMKVVSLHPLVHYLGRARLNTENLWVWKSYTVHWLLESSFATTADPAYFPHIREQMQLMNEFPELPKDTQRRRGFYCCLAILQYQYRFEWHNHGAMDELYNYSKMVLEVLEEKQENNDYVSVIAMDCITSVQANAVQFVDCKITFDQIVRRYLVRQMTPSAALALEKARAIGSTDSLVGKTGAKVLRPSDGHDMKNDPLLDMTTLKTVMAREINTELVAVTSSAEESTNAAEAIESPTWSDTTTLKSPTSPASVAIDTIGKSGSLDVPHGQDYQHGQTDAHDAADSAAGGEKALPNQPKLPDDNLKSSRKQDDCLKADPTTDEQPFKPKHFSDIFISITPPILVQSLKQYLVGLIQTYYTQGRKTEADLLLSYSTLPLDPDPNPDPSLSASDQSALISNLIIEAGRLLSENNLEAMLNTMRKALAAAEPGSLPSHYIALDYAIITNKLGKPEEAERVIKQIFYRTPDQPEAEVARELKDAYVWAKKTLSVSLRLQGQLEASLQTLLRTMEAARVCFGPNSLSCLHAAMLLTIFYRQTSALRSDAEAEKYAEESVKIFVALYGGGEGKVSKEGLQMGVILWAQGALEEAVQVFEAFARLNAGVLGEGDQLTKRARRASVLAGEELDGGEGGARENVLRFGTIMFPRNIEGLAARMDSD